MKTLARRLNKRPKKKGSVLDEGPLRRKRRNRLTANRFAQRWATQRRI